MWQKRFAGVTSSKRMISAGGEFFSPPNPLPPPPGSFGKSGKSSRALTRSAHAAQCEMVTDASGFVAGAGGYIYTVSVEDGVVYTADV